MNADERAEIEWQSYQQDLAVEAAVKAERERVLAEIENRLYAEYAEGPSIIHTSALAFIETLCQEIRGAP